MKITIVKPPPADTAAANAGSLLELAVRDICAQQPGWVCVTLEGKPLPGLLSFTEKNRIKSSIRDTIPDLLLYASPENLLLIQGLPTMVLITRTVSGSTRDSLRKKLAAIQGVITDAAILGKDIIDYSGIDAKRVHTLPLTLANTAGTNDPASTREKFTTGKEYFYYGGAVNAGNEWERLLQAFSVFKKWQRSGLQLLLAGGIAPGYEAVFREKFNSYKYREDVIIMDKKDLAVQKELVAAAFAILSSGRTFNGRMDILHAFESGVPVIADEAPITRALCGDAALFAEHANKEGLSGHMISVYKNEGIYGQLAQAGRKISEGFDRTQMLHQLQAALLAAAER